MGQSAVVLAGASIVRCVDEAANGKPLSACNVADVVRRNADAWTSIGHGWGKSLPVTLSATTSYTPQYQFKSDGTGSKGAISAGVSFGFYVPLFDVN